MYPSKISKTKSAPTTTNFLKYTASKNQASCTEVTLNRMEIGYG
jgi:hypothetical protein